MVDSGQQMNMKAKTNKQTKQNKAIKQTDKYIDQGVFGDGWRTTGDQTDSWGLDWAEFKTGTWRTSLSSSVIINHHHHFYHHHHHQ